MVECYIKQHIFFWLRHQIAVFSYFSCRENHLRTSSGKLLPFEISIRKVLTLIWLLVQIWEKKGSKFDYSLSMSATHWLTNSWNLNALAFSKYLVSLPKLLPAFHSYQNWHQLQAVKAVNIFKQLSKLSTACFSCTIQIYRPFGNGEGKNWKMQWWMCRLLKTQCRGIFHGFW